MSANFRSYFSKNNTLINVNNSNNAKNPVTELIHGGINNIITRFIFYIDFTNLLSSINDGLYIRSDISNHTLHLTNTIRNAEQYAGKRTYLKDMQRSSGFRLEFFKIKQEWFDGNKYDFNLNILNQLKPNDELCNWINAKNGEPWNHSGSFSGDIGDVVGFQDFDNGTEDISLDVTDYVNSIIDNTEVFYGIGIKYSDFIETGSTTNMQSVAFHAKDTNTFYLPYVETKFNYDITDDRNTFYLDKNNSLYLDLRNISDNIIVDSVNIYDYQNILINNITGTSVTTVTKGLYKINIAVSSVNYPDAVIFHDEWNLIINGKPNKIKNKFYIKSFSEYLYQSTVNLDNYYVCIDGLLENEAIIQGDLKRIFLKTRDLYNAKENNLNFEYGIFTQIGVDAQFEIIPFTKVNKIGKEFSIDLNTSWLIPQDYYLKIKQTSGNNSVVKNIIKFRIMKK